MPSWTSVFRDSDFLKVTPAMTVSDLLSEGEDARKVRWYETPVGGLRVAVIPEDTVILKKKGFPIQRGS